MSDIAIPDWNSQGVLPPIDPVNPRSAERSPYAVSLIDFVLRFGTSSARLNILDGLLSFRSGLHEAGLIQGFQWVDGSFLEDIEELESRDPNDIDVVTFFHLPKDDTQRRLSQAFPRLFTPKFAQEDYHVDAYFVQLNEGVPEPLISNSVYWYSLWSHRRNDLWKGYLQIDLSQTNDNVARDNLNRIIAEGTP
jgi:hypothetical protein